MKNKISDSVFKNVKNLKWLPWIGENYFTVPLEKRILIIGESHYHDKSRSSIAMHNKVTFTREVIKDMAIRRNYYGTKLFKNLHYALFSNDEFDANKFWNAVSFYNFIQRPMRTNAERPNRNDWLTAWSVFAELSIILQPRICLFIGTSAAYFIGDLKNNSKFLNQEALWKAKIGNAYAKTALLKNEKKPDVKLIFIRHCSSMFSWSKWHKFLQKEMRDQLRWHKKLTGVRL